MAVHKVNMKTQYQESVFRFLSGTFYVRSPFVSLLSRRSVQQAILFRKTGAVHRITYSFNYFFFLLVFYLLNLFLIYNNGELYPVKQLDHFQETDTVTSLHSHLHHTRTRLTSLMDCQRPLSAPNVFSFKSLPSYLSPTVLNTH